VEPVPTSFHLGPLEFHTYGLGLAIAAYVAFRYGEKRLAAKGLDPARFARFAIWVLVLGLIGARIAHVATNWSSYSSDPLQMLAVWQGGLSSFGGIALAAPAGYILARRYWPSHRAIAVADAIIPVLIAGWALGRVLGPQFMFQGGGHETSQWFGLRYAGQIGKRVPVPVFQSLEDGVLWMALVTLERRCGDRIHPGVITGLGCLVWGVVRFIDETLLLGQGANLGSEVVQITSLVLAAIGAVILVMSWRRRPARGTIATASSSGEHSPAQ
jgi:phosphatidylglycerol---prolipoprotein diacylglyceryl transferase